MVRIPLSRLRRRFGAASADAAPPAPLVATACYAPHTNLFLGTTGDVYPCCDSIGYPLGNVARERLPEIWAGARLHALRAALAADDYSLGCGYCERRLAGGVRPQSRFYDEVPPLEVEPAYPRRIEFNISNACNLQCVMCDGDLSSSIRIHREKRPPLPQVYGEEFFADVVPFVDALDDASFTGGEPFLGAENHRIWDLLITRNPEVRHTVTTNGTRWDRRVEQVLDGLRTYVNVSVDGFSAATYEQVRVGADREAVFANIERFAAYAERAGTEVRIFHCLMPQNHHEFVDLLLFAEQRDLPVGVNVITRGRPEDCIERLPDAELREIRDGFARRADEVLDRLPLNGPVLLAQIDRIDRWLERGDAPLALGNAAEPEVVPTATTHLFTRQAQGSS